MDRPVIVGIAGGSGSGKSTLARNLAASLEGAVLITHDDYYKDEIHGDDYNYDCPEAFDNELLQRHLEALLRGEKICSPIYDYSLHKRSLETKVLLPCPVIILEGILVLENEELRKLFDLKIFVDTPEEERFARRLRRDVRKRGRSPESVQKQINTTVKPMHDKYVEPTKTFADLVIFGGGKDPEAVASIQETILKLKAIDR